MEKLKALTEAMYETFKPHTRLDILNLIPRGGSMLELGTLEGQFADQVLKARPDIKLTCIDNWRGDFAYAKEKASKLLDGRANLQNYHSADAARFAMAGYYFDLVYLDAAHDKVSVEYDLRLWWVRVKKFGILSGHDYEHCGKPLPCGMIEVKPAVDEWAKELGLEVNVIEEKTPSWWVRKP